MLTFPVSHWGPQYLTINNVNDLVLTSYAPFTNLEKNRPIIVTLTGNFYATTTSTFGVNLGNLSTWEQVDIELASGGVIGGDGGNGGNSSNGSGGAGGTGLDLNSANSSANVSFVNNGTIRGGGGGGGGGIRRSANGYRKPTGKDTNCTTLVGTFYSGGGGGGGGRTHLNNSSGGSRTTSTAQSGCSATQSTNGSAGTTSGGGGGGAGGIGRRIPSNAGNCLFCTNITTGGAGGAGGAWGTAGSAGVSGGGGAAGFSVTNTGSVAWTNNGTLTGPTT